MVNLLMVIASPNLVECYSTKSEIRFGYGLLYEHRGQLLHGLNEYHLLVGVDIQEFTFTQYTYQLEQNLNCRQFVNMTILHSVCYSLVPLCINYKTKVQQYQEEINQILESDLPTKMPTVNKSREDPQPQGRYKRFVSTLTRILFDGVTAFVNYKKTFNPSKENEESINQTKG